LRDLLSVFGDEGLQKLEIDYKTIKINDL